MIPVDVLIYIPYIPDVPSYINPTSLNRVMLIHLVNMSVCVILYELFIKQFITKPKVISIKFINKLYQRKSISINKVNKVAIHIQNVNKLLKDGFRESNFTIT